MTVTINGTSGITTPAVTNNGAYTGDGISFADGTPSNTLVTTTGGNVGIGTSSPSTYGQLACYKASGSNFAAVVSGSNQLYIGYDSIYSGGGASAIESNGALAFGTGSSLTERMRIDSSGNLLVGQTSGGLVNNNSFYLGIDGNGLRISHVSGTASGGVYCNFGYNGSSIGSITQSGTTAVAYNTSSDYRLKENITPMTGALATVAQLKPVTYTWKADGSSGQGFIAHELQAVVPDCVTGEKDAVDADGNPVYQGIDTSFLVATLTAAIQELKAELDTVKTELATLKGTTNGVA